MEWIKCSERLPEKDSGILMTYNNLVMVGEFVNGKFYHESFCAHVEGCCKCEEQEGVTHWMFFPQPPENGA